MLKKLEIIYQLALSKIKGIGFSNWKNIIDLNNSAENIFNLNKEELYSLIKNEYIISDILNKTHVNEAEEIINKNIKNNITILSYFDDDYPLKLKEIQNAPCFLYVKGNNILNKKRTLAVIGTRNPTNYGLDNVSYFLSNLRYFNITTVSGLAMGIDIKAHKESLNNNIPTISVLGTALDKILTNDQKKTSYDIIEKGGCIISEYDLGSITNSYNFATRNRIIAGLSDGVLVVEAGNKSGTEITVNYANDYNREVFAIPGNIYSDKSSGCNNFIKNNKAMLVDNPFDIVNHLNWDNKYNKQISLDLNNIIDENDEYVKKLGSGYFKIYNFIKQKQRVSLDEIIEEFYDIPTALISSILLNLEIKNIIKQTISNVYTV